MLYYILPWESHTTADGVHIQESIEMSPDPLPHMYSKETTINFQCTTELVLWTKVQGQCFQAFIAHSLALSTIFTVLNSTFVGTHIIALKIA